MARKPETIRFYRNRLPHWKVVDGLYFITLHLKGAIPESAMNQIREMSRSLKENKESDNLELQRRIFHDMESWLDRAETVRYLAVPEVARMIMTSMCHHQRNKIWDISEYVVMPNHVHLFTTIKAKGLKQSIKDFKRWTGHQAARIIGLDGERFWQDEAFDHWSRSWIEDIGIHDYIKNNPVKARLVNDFTEWPYASWSDKEFQAIVNEQKKTAMNSPHDLSAEADK